MYILKNKLWNSCYLCHLHSYVFSLFSDSSAFFVFVHLNWRANQFETKIAGVSFDRWRFKVFYGVSIVLKVFLGQTVSRRTNCIGMKVRSKLTPHHVTRHLFSHTFVLKNILPSSDSFRSKSHWESNRSLHNSSVFYIW